MKLPDKTGRIAAVVIAVLVAACCSRVEAQTFQTLCSFGSTNGWSPYAAPTLGNDGNFYGTTYAGGSSGFGTVFKVTTSGALTTLVSFSSSTGMYPEAALALGNDGNFYGTTYAGGSSGQGTVFRVTTGGTLTNLVSFSGANGANPIGGLTLGSDGNFYGTTVNGGSGNGTVFKVTTVGALTTVASFNIANGASPNASLTLGKDGNFYGTAYAGGSGYGTVFRVTPSGTLTNLVSFNLGNGAAPYAALTLGTDGNFYGTTSAGGTSGLGTVFKVTTNGALTTLFSFSGSNGSNPRAGLTLGNDGNFYGTTEQDQSGGYGTVFRVTPSGTLTNLLSFNGNNGTDPKAGLTLGNEGNFYGTTWGGGNGNYGYGTVFTLQFPPAIPVQPQSQVANAGATATFLVSATGLNPAYQWRKNGASLTNGGKFSGATTNKLTVTNVSDSDVAVYSVTVTNLLGSVTSSGATLTVIDPPVITVQPLGRRGIAGGNVSFNVTLSGTAPFHYQWRFNGGSILSATDAAYAIQAVGDASRGNYSVVVTNPAGSVTSSNALLTVIDPPTLALQFWSGYPLLNLVGMLHSNYVVQYSTNLARTNWINLLSLSNLDDSPKMVFDPDGGGKPVRFYRAFMQ